MRISNTHALFVEGIMALDTFWIGEIGTGIALPEATEYAEAPELRVSMEKYEWNRPGGFASPQKHGSSQITVECTLYVQDMSGDALDTAYSNFKSALYTSFFSNADGGFIEQKLWINSNWFYPVILGENAFAERHRTPYSVSFGITFVCAIGRKLFINEVDDVVSSGVAYTIVSNVAPPLVIRFDTVSGNTYTIASNKSTGVVRIVATHTGTILVNLEKNTAMRGTTDASDEVEGAFFSIIPGVATTYTMAGIGSARFIYRKAMIS